MLWSPLLSPGVLPSLVAVGTPVARRPPHRSGRAALPHPAPTLGDDAEASAWRTRDSAPCAPARLCVRSALRWREFPLAGPLPSTASAAGRPALFGGFPGTMGPSDFPRPSITGFCPWTSRRGLWHFSPQAVVGSPGSRARCLRACSGSQTARGPFASRDSDALGVAFRLSPRRRHPGVIQNLRGSIPGPHVPLSTLHRRPRDRRRMTRGRCGSLLLHRTKLPFATPRRF